MKVIVCGGRKFHSYQVVHRWLSYLKPTAIVCGGANGADTLAMRFATENSIPLFVHRADWSLGVSAGPIRNEQMAHEHIDLELVIAFPGGAGTRSMLKIAEQAGIPTLRIP